MVLVLRISVVTCTPKFTILHINLMQFLVIFLFWSFTAKRAINFNLRRHHLKSPENNNLHPTIKVAILIFPHPNKNQFSTFRDGKREKLKLREKRSNFEVEGGMWCIEEGGFFI